MIGQTTFRQKINKLVKEHLVVSWAITSAAFAIVIHICFSIPAPVKWFEATWDAGDVLSYASTIPLGLLAMWQNQKFKEEADHAQALMDQQNTEAQNRLERISIDANELALKAQMVEIESNYIELLDKSLTELLDSCSLEYILSLMMNGYNQVAITNAISRISHALAKVDGVFESGYHVLKYDYTPLSDKCKEHAYFS